MFFSCWAWHVAIFAQVGAPPEVAAQIDQLFAELSSDGPGYMIGVIKDQQVVFQKGYGMANLEHHLPITSKTAFNVASLSKQFTAAAVALLILEDKVLLDDPVRKHLPDFPQRFEAIQVKHLIYMTSGLPEYTNRKRENETDWSSVHFFSLDTAIAASLRATELEYTPGSQWSYSNINFMLLAKIVETVSGKRLAEFAREHIFQPLGMRHTVINDNVFEPIHNRADGYTEPEKSSTMHYFLQQGYMPPSSRRFLQIRRNSPHYGGSGVYTTFEDLVKWDTNWYTMALGGPAFYDLMHRRMTFDHPKNNDAFGLVFGDFNGEEIVWYDGHTLGFRAYMIRFPKHRTTVICLSNLETGFSPRSKVDRLVDLLLNAGILEF